MTMIDVVCF